MNELEQALIGDSAAASAANIIADLTEELVRRPISNAPHTIYQELWHITFWQQVTLDWINGIETPFPAKPADGFPSSTETESWDHLCQRFLETAEQAAAATRDSEHLDRSIRCPSRPNSPVRIMSVRDQLISLAAHNHYHLGRIVLLRQLHQAWHSGSLGFTW
jgi:uncharacterized damage-inducible protein DinB